MWEAGARQTLKELNVKLSPEQETLFFHSARFKIGMGGERAGKSFLGGMYLVSRILLGDLFWIVSLDYELARPEFEYVMNGLDTLGLLKGFNFPKEGPCSLTTKMGQTVETKTGADTRRIAGKAPDGIIGCEIAMWPIELFRRVTDRTAEKRGWFLGTGSYETSLGWLPELTTQWSGPNEDDGVALPVPTWSNKILFPGGFEDTEIQRLRNQNTEARFNERFAGIPHPPTGRVFSDAKVALHVTTEPVYDRDKPVYLAIDPGYGSAYAVLAIQVTGDDKDNIRIIDELYLQRQTHSEVIRAAQTRSWWRDVEYAVIDVAGRQHHADRSAIEIWQEEARIPMYSNKVTIQDGIDRVRAFLRLNPETSRARLTMHPKCRGLISEMGLGPSPVEGGGIYFYKTDAAGAVTTDLPIDKHNHSCKALGYFLVHEFGRVERTNRGRPVRYLNSPHLSTLPERLYA